jgi:hypothetical protein
MMFGSSLPAVVCRRTMSYFLYLCLFTYIAVSKIYCVVCSFWFSSSCVPYVDTLCCLVYPMLTHCLRLVYPMLTHCLRLVYPMLTHCLRLVYPMLPVYLDSLFCIAPSLFFNVYLILAINDIICTPMYSIMCFW